MHIKLVFFFFCKNNFIFILFQFTIIIYVLMKNWALLGLFLYFCNVAFNSLFLLSSNHRRPPVLARIPLGQRTSIPHNTKLLNPLGWACNYVFVSHLTASLGCQQTDISVLPFQADSWWTFVGHANETEDKSIWFTNI